MNEPVEFGDLEQPYDWQNIPHNRGGNRVTRNKLNPVPLKSPVAKHAIKLPVAKTAIRAGRGVAAISGEDGYWNLVVGACFLLFVLYIIAHNEVQTWANILLWSPAPPVQVGASTTTAGSQAIGGNSAGGATPAGISSLTPGGTPQMPGLLMAPSNILNNGIDGLINWVNRGATWGPNTSAECNRQFAIRGGQPCHWHNGRGFG
jgi:hypothetical protein